MTATHPQTAAPTGQARRRALAAGVFLAYIGCIVAANWATDRYGLVPVWPGLLATAGTYAAGLALLTRDGVQELLGWRGVAAGIALGGLISWFTSNPQLAVASASAFLVSEVLDTLVYTPLRRRSRPGAILASNTAGALVDSLVFLTLAGFGLAPLAGQMVGKVLWATAVPVALIWAWRRWTR
jgi:queuosine precursor transporter